MGPTGCTTTTLGFAKSQKSADLIHNDVLNLTHQNRVKRRIAVSPYSYGAVSVIQRMGISAYTNSGSWWQTSELNNFPRGNPYRDVIL